MVRFLLPLLLYVSLPAAAATFTVTSGADSGPGTLRQAILDANATPGRDRIVLQANVTTESSLPDITGPVDITGAGEPRFEINTNATALDSVRLHFAAGSAGSTVDSIVFGPREDAIRISTSNVTVTNVLVPVARVYVGGDDNMIGGPAESDRNRIYMLAIVGDGNVVLGNTIDNLLGLGANDLQVGTSAAGNTLGWVAIRLSSSPSVRNNTISQSLSFMNFDPLPGPTVIGNTIGGEFGLEQVTGAFISNNVIRNERYGDRFGILVDETATGVEITNNSIVATRDPGLAIDLHEIGPTPNDPAPDADTGANSLQNFPVLTSARLLSGVLVVEGTLTSAPLTPYRIELFASDAAEPDARSFLGSFMVTTDAAGNATFSHDVTSPLPHDHEVITATATNKATVATPGNTPNSTSEVSAPVDVAVAGELEFTFPAQNIHETEGTVSIAVRRTGGSDGTVTVDFATSDGTATAPADYTATSGTLTFGPGVEVQTIVVPIVPDTLRERNETFTVNLSDATGGATIGTAAATVTITNAAAAAPEGVPAASTWALILMALALGWIGIRR